MKIPFLALLASIQLATLTGCVVETPVHVARPPVIVHTAPVIVRVAPPAPIIETVTVAPIPGQIWIGGAWFWEGSRHVWHPGYWETSRPGYIWVPHRWERHGDDWHFHEGYWDRHH